ncbi:MAG: hypothetical protein WEB58_11420 [Planctomycetaceae bacterium]
MICEQKIADAFRNVALRLELALDEGRRSKRIDAEDLLQTLLALADELDPPVPDNVPSDAGCPKCGERDVDQLVWLDDESVQCSRCRTTYRPDAEP